MEKIISAEENREMPPPARPLQVTKVSTTDFQDGVLDVKRRLVSVLGAHAPRQACIEHVELRREMGRNGILKSTFEEAAEKETATFQECWAPAGTKFQTLRKVCSGFATVFPGSSPVESEFSIVNQDKRPQRSRTADLTVEGGLHAR
eukprot:Plantae.Rhodophyta-Palmaria_palmata.ctg20234.p1 GENE.Plantae.Rhodophyta-Palmaria_palmata.ctg20234~~Plantae.Rhodophyta-Palmaria_palmata.ctg20234.p1  ORF type:complete len:157 (-),score=15.84 Plantae.Rhodophyta-Palmaria_palmata.ctg20234:449-889(-)